MEGTKGRRTDAARWSALIVPFVAGVASVVVTGVANTYLQTSRGAAPTGTSAAPTMEQGEASAADGDSHGAAEAASAAEPPAPQPEFGHNAPVSRAGFKSSPRASEAAMLFADAGRAQRVGAYPKAIALYELLQNRYPDASESRAADMALALVHARYGMPAKALVHFERYLKHSPKGELAAEAAWGKARVLTSLGRVEEAERTLQRLRLVYPNSPYAAEKDLR